MQIEPEPEDAQRLVTEEIENALRGIAFGDKQKKKYKSWLAGWLE